MPHYSLGTIHITSQTHRYLEQVLVSKRLSYGPFCKQFEHKFAVLHQCQQGIVCSSGTAALHIILEALKIIHDWPNGSEIIVPATTFVASINAIIYAGLKPVLVDVEPDSFNINPQLISAKITKKTKAIMPVHLFGKPAKMLEISKISTKNHLLLVEDCCETIIAKCSGKTVGSWGEAAAFSTNSAHILATGIGGVITTNNKQLATLMRSLINHGRNPSYLSIDDDDSASNNRFSQIINSRFVFDHVGYSYRLGEMEAAVGLAQLEDLKILVKKRINNVDYLNQELKPLSTWLQLPSQNKKDKHVFMAYPLVLTSATHRVQPKCLQKLLHFLESKNIETRPLMPVINQPAYKNYQFDQDNYPVTNYLLKSGFYVGCHQDLSQTDLDYFVQTITSFFNNFLLNK